MPVAAFDTHTAAKKLREAGFDEGQAEAAVALVHDAVTKSFADGIEAGRETSADTATLQAGFARLEGATEGHITRLDTRIEGLEGRVGSLEDRVGSLEGRVGSLEGRVGSLEGRVGSLANKVGSLANKVEALTARIENCATRGELYKALWAQGCALIVALTALAGIVAAVVGLLS